MVRIEIVNGLICSQGPPLKVCGEIILNLKWNCSVKSYLVGVVQVNKDDGLNRGSGIRNGEDGTDSKQIPEVTWTGLVDHLDKSN